MEQKDGSRKSAHCTGPGEADTSTEATAQDEAGSPLSLGIDVFRYLDYRQLLRDLYAARRQANPRFSYRFIAQRLSVRSSGYFGSLVAGRRMLQPKLVPLVCRLFRLSNDEATHFARLVQLSATRCPAKLVCMAAVSGAATPTERPAGEGKGCWACYARLACAQDDTCPG